MGKELTSGPASFAQRSKCRAAQKLARTLLLVAVIADGCGTVQCNPNSDVFTSLEGTLSDGSGDADYDSSLFLTWIIAPPPGQYRGPLEITFTEFDVEQGYDTVNVYSCETPACGQTEWIAAIEGVGTISVPTGIAKIEFRSDEIVQYGGFTATWISLCLAGTYSSNGRNCIPIISKAFMVG
eukprot:1750367-Rhodomonas_salina.2